eukprot:GHUV01012575.1.p1 GENE.GHUV01012575.1~~GHUV01012575.1.p1  ORF type:complete len:330 (+),score=91.01 GHUV01012575.1:642-1631(+)
MALRKLRPSTLQSVVQAARCLAAYNSGVTGISQQTDLPVVRRQACACSSEGPSTSYPSLAPAQQWSSNRSFFSQLLKPQGKAYKERRLIGYSPEQLYAVVSSVQHYHQFVPWCVGSDIIKRSDDGSYLEAELAIGFQMISERYTSRVKLQAPHTVSSTVADSALFHHLESVWQLKPGPSPNTTWLSFSVDFAFLNPLYANIAQLFFSEVVTRMMGAFEGRCQHLYGPPSFIMTGQKQPAQQHQLQRHRPGHTRLPHHRQPLQQQKRQQVATEQLQQQPQQRPSLQVVPSVAAAGLAVEAVAPGSAAVGDSSQQSYQQCKVDGKPQAAAH